MSDYQSNPLFLHPLLHSTYKGILEKVTSKLPTGWTALLSSQGIHRTPNEQMELFKKGREFKNGKWVVVAKSEVVTGKDGFENKSRHNFLPATAIDVILRRPDGSILSSGKEEKLIEAGALLEKFEWGGSWTGFQDMPHIQLPPDRLFKANLELDEALQWQKYLFHAGNLPNPSDLDGYFGKDSKTALQKTIGTTDCTPGAWAQLFQTYGPIEDMDDFKNFKWIPSVLPLKG